MSNRNLSILVLALYYGIVIVGCTTTSEIDGKKAYDTEQYWKASQILEKEFNSETDQAIRAEKAYKIADCYKRINDPDKAAGWYKSAVELEYGPMAIYEYAMMLKKLETYDVAVEQLRKYEQEVPDQKDKVAVQIKACEEAIRWKASKSKYKVETLSGINSGQSDYAPTFYENKSLVFTSDRTNATGDETFEFTGNKFSDIFVAELNDLKKYGNPKLFDEMLNTIDNEGTAIFNPNYTEIFFTRCISTMENSKGDYCKIFYSRKNSEGKWEDAISLDLFSDSTDYGHPALTADGSKLIFSANPPDGYGGKDLYMSSRTGSGWSSPVNLGAEYNTAGDEMFPYVDSDGSLYFASDGLPGMGGLDVFIAEVKGDSWDEPMNLRAPLNSGGDDFGVMFDEFNKVNHSGYYESTGYFCSSRKGGMGKDDIYKFTVTKPAYFELSGDVLKKILKDPSDPNSPVLDYKPVKNAKVELVVYDKLSGMDGVPIVVNTDDNGKFHYELEPDTDYKVKASKPGFLNKEQEVTTRELEGKINLSVVLTIQMELDTLIEDVDLVLENIYYDYDDWKILPTAAQTLDKLVKDVIKPNPDIKVEIGSHTDARGSASYNEKLSQRRAESCVKYIASRGIDRKRLVAKGYGESTLLNECTDAKANECTEEQHARNRRTTFRVLSDKMTLESREKSQIGTKGRVSDKPYENLENGDDGAKKDN